MNTRLLGEVIKDYHAAKGVLAATLRSIADEVSGSVVEFPNGRASVKRVARGKAVWTNGGKPGRPHMQVGAYVSHRVRNGKKVCTKCQLVKSASMFGPRTKSASRLQSWCRMCQAREARRQNT